MRYTLCILLLTTLALAGGRHAAINPSAIHASPSPSPISSDKIGIEFQAVDYYTTPAERIKIKQVGALVNQVVQSQCFGDFMSTRRLIQTNGRTNAEVIAHIRSLAGVVPVEMYYRRFGSAVAYRNPGSPTIHLNRKAFWPGQSDVEWASVMTHEGVGHALGEYGHDFNWSPSRDFSVPYSMNAAVEKCLKSE